MPFKANALKMDLYASFKIVLIAAGASTQYKHWSKCSMKNSRETFLPKWGEDFVKINHWN
jgi:hypothetical protein